MKQKFDKPSANLNESIESGEYYARAREWYSMIYIGPISQRVFFIIVTCVAIAIFLMAVMSVFNLLPISPRVPFMYRTSDMITQIPRMERFKRPSEAANPALLRYYLSEYVRRRESFDYKSFLNYYAFIRNYTEPGAFVDYHQTVDQNNPVSPIQRYGRERSAEVLIHQVRYDRTTLPATATVDFSTIVVGNNQRVKSDWTATLRFEYTDMNVRNHYDPEIDDYQLEIIEPTFQVLGYNVRERLITAQ